MQTKALVLSDGDARLVAILTDKGIDFSPLQCEFSRQQGAGTGRFKGPMSAFGDGTYRIEYDLMLCTYCGNLLPQQPCCPAKLQKVKDWMIGLYLANLPEPPALPPVPSK